MQLNIQFEKYTFALVSVYWEFLLCAVSEYNP
jgi:hypothetical protein